MESAESGCLRPAVSVFNDLCGSTFNNAGEVYERHIW